MDGIPTPSPNSEIVRKAGVILFRRLPLANIVEYLLMNSSTGKQSWGPPKGHMEPGENNDQTAFREVKEETGLEEKNFRIVPDFDFEFNYKKCKKGINRTIITKIWLAEVIDPHCKITTSIEHQAYKWVPLNEAKDLLKTRGGYEEYRKCFEKCEEKIQSL